MTQFDILSVVGGKVTDSRKCAACDLSQSPYLVTNCMDGIGPENVDFMFVGQNPVDEDDSKGIPYSGAGGDIFHSCLLEAGINPEHCFITNCLKCAPFGEKVKDKHWQKCKGYLVKEIRRVRPKCIVAVGAQALKWLTGMTGGDKLRKHGLPCLLDPEILVYPLKQPAAIFHAEGNAKKTVRNEIVDDLMWLRKKSREGLLNQSDEIATDYRVAETPQDVLDFCAELEQHDTLVFDFETVTTDYLNMASFPEEGGVIAAVGFSTGIGHGRAIPLYACGIATFHYWTDEDLDGTILPAVRKLLKTKKLIGQNCIQFDQKWAQYIFGIDRLNVVFDTMLAHFLLDEEKGTHGLEALAMKYTTMQPWKKLFSSRETVKLCHYLCKDVDATWRIYEALKKQLTPQFNWLLQEVFIPMAHELSAMEFRGVNISKEALTKLGDFLTNRLKEVEASIKAIPAVQLFELEENTAINVDSPEHLSTVMERYLKLPCIEKTNKGAYSTNVRVLEALQDQPFVQLVMQTRGLSKLKGTYCDGMEKRIKKDGRIHTSFFIHGTETGRLASSDPNLQNIPREDTAGKVLDDGNAVKKIFVPTDGCVFVAADYSQAELRTLAMLSHDKALTQIFLDGLDAHTATAAKAYGIPIEQVSKAQRTNAKKINFGVVYGKTEISLIDDFIAAGTSSDDAKAFLKFHKEVFFDVWKWMDSQEALVRRQMYQDNLFGFRRRYKKIDNHTIRQAYNTPVQGSAAFFTNIALVRIAKAFRELGLPAVLLLTVHDSILAECEVGVMWDVAHTMQYIMEHLDFPFMTVPLVADLEAGYSWGSMKKIDVANRKVLK